MTAQVPPNFNFPGDEQKGSFAAITHWHFFKDAEPEPDACIMVHWVNDPTHEMPELEMSCDLSYYDGKLFDVNYNEMPLDLTGESVMWAYWPKPGQL